MSLERALAAFFQSQNREAASQFEALLAQDSRDVLSVVFYGLCQLRLDNLTKMHECFEASFAIDEQHSYATVVRSIVLREEGRVTEALRLLEGAFNGDPQHDSIVYFQMAYNTEQLDNNDDEHNLRCAVELYRTAVRLNPQYIGAYLNLGYCLDGLELFAEAIDAYDTALEMNPRLVDLLLNKSRCLNELERYEEAVELIQHALSIDPNYHELYFNLARSHIRLRQFDKALECYERVIELRPRDPEAYMYKASLLERQGCVMDAIGMYERMNEATPHDALQTYDQLIEAAMRQAHALRLVVRQYGKGNCLLVLGRLAEAIRVLDGNSLPVAQAALQRARLEQRQQKRAVRVFQWYLLDARYRPGGAGSIEAKQHFEHLLSSLSLRTANGIH